MVSPQETNPASASTFVLRPNAKVLLFRALQGCFFLGWALFACSIGLPATISGSIAAAIILLIGLSILWMSIDILLSLLLWPSSLRLNKLTASYSARSLLGSFKAPPYDKISGYSTATFYTQGRNDPPGVVLYSTAGAHIVIAPANVRDLDALHKTLNQMKLPNYGPEGRVGTMFKQRYRYDPK